jgi:hypothetical protein
MVALGAAGVGLIVVAMKTLALLLFIAGILVFRFSG